MNRLIVMISGNGTNLQALLDAQAAGKLKAEVVLVVSNRQKAFGLERARQAGVETLYFPLKPYTSAGQTREMYDSDLAMRLLDYQPDLIVLAGWMHILSPAFLDCFPNKVINLHPALYGTFPGANAIERAYEAYQQGEIQHSGCMVHYVIPEVDAGEVIDQEVVPIQPEDTFEDFEKRMHHQEHLLIVRAVNKTFTVN
ncbi:MAG: phosphoribosylglycinamide formyltransferase [Anaerolineae bacterium]|nr:phosphoribosylglycinamide formyltransferase [Anaerolineae bacterium]